MASASVSVKANDLRRMLWHMIDSARVGAGGNAGYTGRSARRLLTTYLPHLDDRSRRDLLVTVEFSLDATTGEVLRLVDHGAWTKALARWRRAAGPAASGGAR